MPFLPSEIIKKKRNNAALSEEEIAFFIQEYTQGQIPDYQMSALLMAIYFQGMNEKETLSLTKSMLHSGVVADLGFIKKTKIDKHSTGGVGDKTSLILGPIVAAAGVPVPMISGRGLGHTGGTLDKLESIPGFNTQLDLKKFAELVEKELLCFIGQTKEICPADKKIYALRDVTATVESLPLICASIMSKKIAEGIDGLVLDVKFGSGAFMKTAGQAEALAKNLMAIAKGYGKKVAALLTDMNQPLGRFAGNALEVFECIEIMSGRQHLTADGRDLYEDTRELSLWLSGYMIWLGDKAASAEDGYRVAQQMLTSGAALKKFEEICRIQGGDLKALPKARHQYVVQSDQQGHIQSFNTEKIGIACILLGAGRAKTSDAIVPTTGVEFHKKIGDAVSVGDPLFTIHADDSTVFETVENELTQSVTISLQKNKSPSLILKTLV